MCRVSESLKVWGLESGDLGDWKSGSLGFCGLGVMGFWESGILGQAGREDMGLGSLGAGDWAAGLMDVWEIE